MISYQGEDQSVRCVGVYLRPSIHTWSYIRIRIHMYVEEEHGYAIIKELSPIAWLRVSRPEVKMC